MNYTLRLVPADITAKNVINLVPKNKKILTKFLKFFNAKQLFKFFEFIWNKVKSFRWRVFQYILFKNPKLLVQLFRTKIGKFFRRSGIFGSEDLKLINYISAGKTDKGIIERIKLSWKDSKSRKVLRKIAENIPWKDLTGMVIKQLLMILISVLTLYFFGFDITQQAQAVSFAINLLPVARRAAPIKLLEAFT